MISNTLQKKLNALMKEKVDLENQLEAEQESIVNKLSKEISKLRKEKETLVLEVEREEELLTNTLSKKLDREHREKEELAALLRKEQHQVGTLPEKGCWENTLQRQLTQTLLYPQVQDLKTTLQEDARLISQLKGVVSTMKDKEAVFKAEDRDLLFQVSNEVVV